jgi:hypothetical protein
MKGFETKNTEVESNFDDEGIDMSIASEDMSFVYDIMFNQMYRDPIGSAIREITSNCFDSHIEAGVKDAVVIWFGSDDGGEFITFKDVGVGISPDRMKKIYSKPAKSTKRDSQDQHGYWGLGSKSPLAYQEMFSLITVFDKIKYEYVVHRGTKSPRISKMDEYPTEERNGSEVKLYIKERETNQFHAKLVEQLRYFDNVYVKNSWNFNNSYKLYEGKTFRYRDDTDDRIVMHLCVGKVVYPIDWFKLKREPINLPIGVKFAIGELPITPERESIRYVKLEREGQEDLDVIEVINKRIDECLEEVRQLEAAVPKDHNNLADYYKYKDDKPCITLLGNRIYIAEIPGVQKHRYSPLEDYDLELPRYPFWQYEEVAYLRIRLIEQAPRRLTWESMQDNFIVRLFNSSTRIAQVKLDYIRQLATEKGQRNVLFLKKMGREEYASSKTFARDIRDKIALHGKTANLQNYDKGINWLTKWKQYDRAIETEVIINTIDINDIEVPEAWAKEWKKKNTRKKDKFEVELGKEVVVKDCRINPKTARDRVFDLERAAEFDGFIIYGFSDDEETLEKWAKLFSFGEFEQKAKVIQIKYKDHPYFQEIKQAVYVHHFMSNNPIFRKIANAAIIRKSPIWNISFYPVMSNNRYDNPKGKSLVEVRDKLGMIFKPLGETIDTLNKARTTTVNFNGDEEQESFIKELTDLAEANDWFDPQVKASVQRVEKYFEGLDLIKFIAPEEEAIPYMAEFFSLKGKKVDPIFTKPEAWEVELMQECNAKYEYLRELSIMAHTVKLNSYNPKDKTSILKRLVLANQLKPLEVNIKFIQTTLKYYERKASN